MNCSAVGSGTTQARRHQSVRALPDGLGFAGDGNNRAEVFFLAGVVPMVNPDKASRGCSALNSRGAAGLDMPTAIDVGDSRLRKY